MTNASAKDGYHKIAPTLVADGGRSISRFRLPAVLCAGVFSICELISKPFAELGIADDWSYIRTVKILAGTGHVVYNWCATPVVGWQLYLAATLVRLFGFSFTTVRMATLLVGAAAAFLIQRTFVRAGVSECNSLIGTLALILSPIYMMLSVTFMTDIGGLFAIFACVYGCLRALQAVSSSAAVGWIWFAVIANGICGSSRQIAWLGVLVILPCTLWLLRHRRRVLVRGAVAIVAGWGFVAFCMHWFHQQPYTCQEKLIVSVADPQQAAYMVRELLRALLEVPFLTLPLTVAFLPQVRRGGWRGLVTFIVGGAAYTLLALRMARDHGATAMLQPLLPDWLGPQGFYHYPLLANEGPVVLGLTVRVVLTVVSIAGLFGIVIFLLWSPRPPIQELDPASVRRVSWRQIGFILGPFAVTYFALLVPRSKGWVLDRYLLELAFVAALCLTRAYQDFVRPSLPAVTTALVSLTAVYAIGCTHDMFAYYRARVELTNELQAAGVPDHTIDGGFEYNYEVELEHGGHINDERLSNPLNSYAPVDKYRGFTCRIYPSVRDRGNLTPEQQFNLEMENETDPRIPHFMPMYGIAFEPTACRGAAQFAPVDYFRWLGFQRTTLYAVRYGPR